MAKMFMHRPIQADNIVGYIVCQFPQSPWRCSLYLKVAGPQSALGSLRNRSRSSSLEAPVKDLLNLG